MAAAAHDSDSDESWEDYLEQDPDRDAALDAEIAQKDQLLQEPSQNGDWCTCSFWFQPQHPFSAYDVTCCHESQPAREMCNGVSGQNASDKTLTHEMPLIYVFGGWGFGVEASIFCIGVLGH